MFASDVELEKSFPTAGSMNVGQENVTLRTLRSSGIGSSVSSGATSSSVGGGAASSSVGGGAASSSVGGGAASSVGVAAGAHAATSNITRIKIVNSFFMFLLHAFHSFLTIQANGLSID
jgi:hypothetical protein